MKAKQSIFLTGVTGTLGKEMVKELLLETDYRIFLLIRRKNRFSHWDRARRMLASFGCESHLGTRVQVLEGDVTLPEFGLQIYELDVLRREVDVFFHIAAITALNGSREDCYSINLGGTIEALKLANQFHSRGCLQRFIYFSTAYAAGSLQDYLSFEDELPANPAHANHYESSKYASEQKVREAMKEGLPTTIFRPSIVVGDSKTGEVSEFNVIYPFMKLFAHGILKKLPTRPDNSFNIVPIDFVIKASLEIAAQHNSAGKAYHLVSPKPPTIDMLMTLKQTDFPEFSPIEIIDPDSFKKEDLDYNEQIAYSMLEPYLGYLNDHLAFDMKNTEEALKGTGVLLPETDYGFLKTITQYAIQAGYLMVPN